MNPNYQQAIEDEEAGLEEEGEDIDYDALYGGEDLDSTPGPRSEELENSYKKLFGDFAKQFGKHALIGVGGTYGDLAELAGLRASEAPNIKEKNKVQTDILEKLGQPGYIPGPGEIHSLSNEDLTPDEGIPTSQRLGELSDIVGGPGEPETPAGKYGKRAGRIFGSEVAFGGLNPAPALVAGGAGEAVEHYGGGPLLQAAAEIASLILTKKASSSKALSSKDPEISKKINDLRKLGYSDEEITLALNHASQGKVGGIKASKGESTKQAFEDFSTKSDEIVGDILTQSIPGYERGPQYVHQMASDAYGQVAEQAGKLNFKNMDTFVDVVDDTIKQVRQKFGNSKEAKEFIETLTTMGTDFIDNPNAELLMNFYQQLNRAGKWMGRSTKDHLITRVKDGVKKTFQSEGPAGKQLAENFEKVNKGIQRAYKAEEIHEILDKVWTQNGADFKKFNKVFDKAENVKLFQEVLGPEQAKNVQMISRVGKEIKDFDKAWKAVSSSGSKNLSLLYAIYHQNWPVVGILGAEKIGKLGGSKLAEKFLTDPSYQNLMIKGLHAIKTGSTKSFSSVSNLLLKKIEDEGLDVE